jgi:hypothetical protein
LQRLLLLPLSLHPSQITSSHDWNEFVAATAELQLVNVSQLSNIEKTCFFLNVYHIMVLHGIIDREFVQGSDIKEKWLQFARGIKYMVGAFNYSIESIEELLKQASITFSTEGRLSNAPLRAGGGLMMCMSRMTVASPSVQVFHPSLWENQIVAACREVCSRVTVISSAKTVVLPKVFETHRDVFPSDAQELLSAISVDCPSNVQHALLRAAHSSYKIKFEREDWRVSLPSQPVLQEGAGALARAPVAAVQNVDEQLAHGSNHSFEQQQQQQYALEYRGDLTFHLPPTPNFAPPNVPCSDLTSIGLPAFVAATRWARKLMVIAVVMVVLVVTIVLLCCGFDVATGFRLMKMHGDCSLSTYCTSSSSSSSSSKACVIVLRAQETFMLIARFCVWQQ